MPNYDEKKFRCPYCFGEMTHRDVLFRANTGFTWEELEESDSGFTWEELGGSDSSFTMGSGDQARQRSSELEIKRLFRRYDDETSFASDKKLDEKLIRFWKDRGGSSGYVNADPYWDYPHIDPKDPDSFRKMISLEPCGPLTPDSDGFVRDKDGFITQVIDRFSDPTRKMKRLCPHCHNPLPLPDYGKFPLIFISVVGITSSGKTVYINQLLTKFATVMHKTGYTLGPSALAVNENEVVMKNHPLPSSTDDKIMRRPLAASLTKEGNPAEGITIVFYDIAGENCVPPRDSTGRQQENATTIGNFIAYCDGLIFLIDPAQVPILSPLTDSRAVDVQKVIDIVKDIRAALNRDQPDWDDIPVAAVLTKSDTLTGRLDPDSLIFHHCTPGFPGFNRDDFVQIHRQLAEKFQENARDISASMDGFATKAYFAISAITCGVEMRFEKYQNHYFLTAENYNKFKTLLQWVRGWNGRTAQERERFRPCPVRDAAGAPISFPYDSAITAENATGISTEIFAESVQDGYVDKIYLDLWDVASESINPVGYPIAEPNPRRIEEPIKWILWQKRLLAPTYTPSPAPTKKLLESERKYNQRLDEWRAENALNEMRFYKGEDL